VQPQRLHRAARQVSGLLAVALLSFACGVSGSNTAAPADGGTLQFGAIVGLSGIYGPYGAAYEAGMNVAAARVNAAGGIVAGGKKYTLKMLYMDDRSDAQVAIADAITMFNDDKIDVVVGPLANEAISATPVIAQHKAINLSLAASLFGLLGPNYPLLFSALPSNDYRVGATVSGIKHFYPSAKKVDFLTGANDGLLKPMSAQLQAAGITAGDFTYPPGTKDISTVATKVVADKPDIIVVGTSPQEEQSDIQQLDAAGLPKSVPCVCYSTELPSSIGHPQLFPSAYSPVDPGVQSTPEIEAFKTALKAELNGADATPFNIGIGLAYYFVVQLAAKAMTKANTVTDTTAISKAMTEVSMTEFGAKFQFASDHTITVPLAVTQISASGQTTVAQLAPGA
jgi:ABC-type branched-subunit amino acid transport system substrate-binding protein